MCPVNGIFGTAVVVPITPAVDAAPVFIPVVFGTSPVLLPATPEFNTDVLNFNEFIGNIVPCVGAVAATPWVAEVMLEVEFMVEAEFMAEAVLVAYCCRLG